MEPDSFEEYLGAGEGDSFSAPTSVRPRNTVVDLDLSAQQFIQQSARYLLIGVLLGVLGFVTASLPFAIRIAIAIENDAVYGTNLTRSLMLPATVSELVSQWETVEARVFFGFEIGASFCILLSWYPFLLRYGSCIPSDGGCRISFGCCGSISWATWRQFLPPLGLLLVACVPTVKQEDWTPESMVLVVAHCAAAMMMFAGFLMAEAHALSLWPFRCDCQILEKDSMQYRRRRYTWFFAGTCFGIFTCMQGFPLIAVAGKQFNVISFTLEVLAGLAMLANHFVIWLYSPERHWGNRGFKMRKKPGCSPIHSLWERTDSDDLSEEDQQFDALSKEDQPGLIRRCNSVECSSCVVLDSSSTRNTDWESAILDS